VGMVWGESKESFERANKSHGLHDPFANNSSTIPTIALLFINSY